MIENRYNLIDEPWIPVVDSDRASLREVFSNPHLKALGGNPVQKIAITKLLLAIAQSAYTPENDSDWEVLGAGGVGKYCLEYLDKWHDRFYLYGKTPFLQMPAILKAEIQPFGALLPEVATGNTTVLTQIQQEKQFDDADKALLIIQLMGFALGGKKTDNSVVLTLGYTGKSKTGKPGASIGYMGFLHSFLQGTTLQSTIWLNICTQEQIDSIKTYSSGLGVAPWEKMPIGEDDYIAKHLSTSLIGRLIPLCRFMLLTETGVHYSEGISHLGYKDGMFDPSISVNFSGKDQKAIWVDPDKSTWRMLTSLLSFITASDNNYFNCIQLRFGLPRGVKALSNVGIWSGGIRVSSNAGEQYVSGSNDFVESVINLPTEFINEIWFSKLQTEMVELDIIAKSLYGCVMSYYKNQTSDGKSQAAQATNLFWQLCERRFQQLLSQVEDKILCYELRIVFASFVHKAYNCYCGQATARQLDAWVQSRPNLAKYLKKDN